ncbi:MAG: terpene cyclase/mutase family protein [Armatimonadota bacterium]|nr:terpene cyclase/mutase family protein [Armatimonadota bacterium]MDR7451671.1 terpene cyclase/mutase family protein [Armatimonadota bacterium]MDR7465711.1 terpene cyclase/mutase family protein [Armatimonadota bacterium]MDR7493620.1 terpene cyclase/mutase family protein [Armatimonadota bacterium]MDR7499132.1 terpene cyclase/mutase family protein [Armatimonadota bacterium]
MNGYLARAVAYIQENGDELERGRLAGLLGRERPEPKAVRALLTRQNEDGGFPYQMVPGRPSAVTSTAAALQWLHDLRLAGTSQVERAGAYLLTVQRPDGTWEESPALIKYDPPPLARPGHAAGRTYCTALGAYWLARLLGVRHDSVQRAAQALRAWRDGGRPEDEPLQVAVLAAVVMAMIEGPGSAAAGLEALERVNPEAWTADRLVELLGGLHTAGFAAEDPLVAPAIRRLLGLQREDGGWTSEQGADREVDLSLRALGVLLAYGVPSGSG